MLSKAVLISKITAEVNIFWSISLRIVSVVPIIDVSVECQPDTMPTAQYWVATEEWGYGYKVTSRSIILIACSRSSDSRAREKNSRRKKKTPETGYKNDWSGSHFVPVPSLFFGNSVLRGRHGVRLGSCPVSFRITSSLMFTKLRGTLRENSSKPLKHSIVKRILVFKW